MDDLISRQAMLDGIDKLIKIHFDRTVVLYKARQVAENLPSVQPETNCSEIPNNSDTISRQQAIDALRAMQTYKLFAGDDMLLIDQAEAQTELMSLPSAQPERKTGRWILDRSGRGRHECSRCHEYAPCYQDGSEHLSTFCVLCGAKMESGGKQE